MDLERLKKLQAEGILEMVDDRPADAARKRLEAFGNPR
jgi:hypothetical protein